MFERMAKVVIKLDKFVKSSSYYLKLMEEKVLKMTTKYDNLKATPIERSGYWKSSGLHGEWVWERHPYGLLRALEGV